MRQFIQHAVITLAVAGLLAAGCATHKSARTDTGEAPSKSAAKPDKKKLAKNSATNAAPTTAQQIERHSQALAHYATGVSLEMQDKADAALEEFALAALADVTNEELVLDVGRRLIRKRDQSSSDKVLALLKKAAAEPAATASVDALYGVALAQAGRTNEALASSRIAIKKDPRLFQGYQTAAQVHLQGNRVSDALKVMDEAAKISDPDVYFLTDLAELYAAAARVDAKQLDAIKPRALATLERAAKFNPTSPSLIQRLAESYRGVGEFAKAADLYSGLLKRFPDQPALRERLIDLYLRGNDRKAATEQLQNVLKQNPGNPQALFFLGVIAHEDKDYDKAVDLFDKTISISPDMEQAYFEMAAVRLAQDKPKDALAVLARARQRLRNSFLLEFYTALAHSRLKDYSTALAHFTTAEELAKKNEPERLNTMFYFQLGATHERNKNLPEAERYFEECLKLDPDFAEALNYLGYMWAERGTNLDRAKGMIEKAVKLEPDNAAFLDSLGWVHFKLGHSKEALPWLLKSIEHVKEPDATIYDHLGDVYLALKQTDQAREHWRKALAIEPDNADIKKKLDLGAKP